MDANEVGAQQTETGSPQTGPGVPTDKNERLAVVGIGAFAGGLTAMQRFFDAMPAHSGLSFVVVTHMDPERESSLPQLLKKHTSMPVRQVLSLTQIEPDTVYVIPPGRRIHITATHLDTEEFDEPRGQRTPIDAFFRSMAAAHRQPVAILFSGGADGAVGVKAVKEQLLIEKELSEKIVATVREGLLVLKPDLTVEYANDSFYQMFDVEKQATIGSRIYDLGNEQWDIPALRTLLEEILPQRSVFNDFRVKHEFETVGLRIMLLNARRLDHVERILLAIEDITEREQYEHELRESEARYRTLFESIDAGFCIVEVLLDDDPVDYRFLETNPAFQKLTGLKNAVGKRMRALRPNHEEHWFKIYGEIAHSGEAQRFTQRAEHLGDRWYDVYAFPVSDAAERRVAILFTDITQQKVAEKALRELNEQLEERVEERTAQVRDLASQLTMAEHEERARISRILHDDLQQQLYGMQIQLTFLRSATESLPAAADMLHEIDDLEQLVQTSIQTARQLSVELSPPILQGEGLAEAISWLANLMYERYKLQINIQGQGSFIVPDLDRRVLLFQSVRELLFNIVKHANVHVAAVQLNEVEDPLLGTVYQISVSDDGVGFDPQEVLGSDARPTGRGLLFIRERLRFIGGRLEIESVPGDGVIVTIIAPVEEILAAAEET